MKLMITMTLMLLFGAMASAPAVAQSPVGEIGTQRRYVNDSVLLAARLQRIEDRQERMQLLLDSLGRSDKGLWNFAIMSFQQIDSLKARVHDLELIVQTLRSRR